MRDETKGVRRRGPWEGDRVAAGVDVDGNLIRENGRR